MRQDTFGECFIAQNFANHEVPKIKPRIDTIESTIGDPLDLFEIIGVYPKDEKILYEQVGFDSYKKRLLALIQSRF